jgi:hypothetical protein
MGDASRGSPIPLHGGIKAHALCEENTHLRHIQRFDPSVTEYYNVVSEPGLPVPPLPGGPALLSRESQNTQSPSLRFRALLTEDCDPRVHLHRA